MREEVGSSYPALGELLQLVTCVVQRAYTPSEFNFGVVGQKARLWIAATYHRVRPDARLRLSGMRLALARVLRPETILNLGSHYTRTRRGSSRKISYSTINSTPHILTYYHTISKKNLRLWLTFPYCRNEGGHFATFPGTLAARSDNLPAHSASGRFATGLCEKFDTLYAGATIARLACG